MLIVENGTMPEGANTYVSLDEADAYLVARGLWPVTGVVVDAGAGTETPDAEMVAQKEAALIRAADWLNALPGGTWKSEQVDSDWIMAWPRVGYEGIPQAVKRAQMEVAALIFAGDDMLAPKAHGGAVASESVSSTEGVGPLSESTSRSVSYFAAAPAETYYPAVAGLLARYLDVVPGRRSGGGFMEVGRG